MIFFTTLMHFLILESSNINLTSIAIPAKKIKTNIRRKCRSMKYHAKNQIQHHQFSTPKTKFTMQPDFKLQPIRCIDSSFPKLDARTRYADALKKNLSYEEEEDSIMSEYTTMTDELDGFKVI